MSNKEGISIFYVQCVLACMGILCIISLSIYMESNDTQERIPLYFPSSTAFENGKNIDNTMYVPEFRIIPEMSIYDIVFRFDTSFVIKKVLHELLLGSHSIYMRQVIPVGVSVCSILIGKRNKDDTYKIFIQLEDIRKNKTNHDFDKIEHWLTYNMNVYFPSYKVQVTQ